MNLCRITFFIVVWWVGTSTLLQAADDPFVMEGIALSPGSGKEIILSLFGNKTLADTVGDTFQNTLNTTIEPLRIQLSKEVNDKIKQFEVTPMLHAMADAGTLADSGIPVDYATPFKIFSLSLGGGAAVNGEALKIVKSANFDAQDGLPKVGAAPNLTFLLGFNLGSIFSPSHRLFDPSRLSLYGNYAAFDSSRFPAFPKSMKISYRSYGFNAQYKLLRPTKVFGGHWLRWGGLSLISGFNYSAVDIALAMQLPQNTQETSIPLPGSSEKITTQISWTGDAHVGAQMHYLSIPVEMASSVELLRFLSLFGGAGFDFNSGYADTSIALNSPVEVSAINPKTSQSYSIAKPKASLDLVNSAHPSPHTSRFFGGVQFNLPLIKIFAQSSVASSGTYGLHLGVRMAW